MLTRTASSYRFEGLTNGTVVHGAGASARCGGNTSAGVTVGPLTPSATAVTQLSGTLPVGEYDFAGEVLRITGTVIVPSAAVMNLGPGTVVKFDPSTYLQVNAGGELNALGSAVRAGGVHVDHGRQRRRRHQQQRSVGGCAGQLVLRLLHPELGGRMDHVQVRFGGGSGNGQILAYRFADVDFTNVLVEQSAFERHLPAGFRPARWSSRRSVTMRRTGFGFGRSSGSGGPFVLRNNDIHDNGGSGIYVQGYGVPIEDNTLADNASFGVFYSGAPSEGASQ